MLRTRTIRCACCGLDQLVTDDSVRPRPALFCLRCSGHRDATPEAVARLEADHALMYLRALVDSQDDTALARAERDHYHDRMRQAYESRELAVGVLAKIEQHHQPRGRRCSCGQSRCAVAESLTDPRVARLVSSYDEQARTLRELRRANPDSWHDRWDGIDETVVYPPRRTGVGRHRAG